MSIISQNYLEETEVFDCIQRFFSKHKIGSLLKKCNGTKEKGVPVIEDFGDLNGKNRLNETNYGNWDSQER